MRYGASLYPCCWAPDRELYLAQDLRPYTIILQHHPLLPVSGQPAKLSQTYRRSTL
ncbi:hypothetical protein I79_011142 [Cricetulus griseus]|uniref:Uncharacterized protein n=1 Tax=Cricetulus griseus TaxID=10029 RepID=G3HKC3_CRIGR|nr:hypothetical protein I79_011142 [Cricetulus griseus]